MKSKPACEDRAKTGELPVYDIWEKDTERKRKRGG